MSAAVEIVCSRCSQTSHKSAAMIRLSRKRNGGEYVCGPCLRSAPEAKARHHAAMEHLRLPKTVKQACSCCGEVQEVTKEALRHHTSGGRPYRCLKCGQKAGREKWSASLERVPTAVELTCSKEGCSATIQMTRGKWRSKWRGREDEWICRSWQDYAEGKRQGTRGMTFVDYSCRDHIAERILACCPVCGKDRLISVETALRMSGLSQTVRHSLPNVFELQCLSCASVKVGAGLRLPREVFIGRCQAVHHLDQYDYADTDYTGMTERVTVRCLKHGPFTLRAGNHIVGQRCPVCASRVSRPTLQIGGMLEALGCRVEYNNRRIIAPREIDLWLPDHRVGVEFHGLYWHSERMVGSTYHQDKWRAMPEGTRLIQIFEDEWRDRRPLVEAMLKHRIGVGSMPVYARKCSLGELDRKAGRAFFHDNHIQGADASQRYFALSDAFGLVAVMSFMKPSLSGGSKKVDCPGPYLELFARRQRMGWSTWGNEVPCDVQIDTSNDQGEAQPPAK